MIEASDLPETVEGCEVKHRELSRRLAATGFSSPGTLQSRLLTCGQPLCSCHQDPEARHGPYLYWTTKQGQKTVSRKVTEAEAEVLRQWIENRRERESILKEMNQIAQHAIDLLLDRGRPLP